MVALWMAAPWMGPLAHADTEPVRLISLAPHLTELAFTSGAGEQLVGVVDYSDWPEDAKDLPSIGDAFRFDMETILSLNPTHALAWSGGTSQALANQLHSLGIEVEWIQTKGLSQIADAMIQIGELANTESVALSAAEDYQAALSAWPMPDKTSSAARPVTVFYQISKTPLYTFGQRHVINEVLGRCGAQNIFSDMDVEALVVDIESVVARKPDLILSGHEPDSVQGQADPLGQWRVFRDGALKDTVLHSVDPNLLVRPTPRIIEGIDQLCSLTQSINQSVSQ